jgi:hypothetical protein
MQMSLLLLDCIVLLPLVLQLLAEAWVKAHYPNDAAVQRERGRHGMA